MNSAFVVWLPRPKRHGTWMTWGGGGHALQCGEAEMCCGGRTHVGVFRHALGMGGHGLGMVGHRLGMVGHGFGMGGHRFANLLRSS
jgi:hypothetical protein